jgi:EAL domain-containing protein (putative c-di-GMP-specific phosphodiesterase class I)
MRTALSSEEFELFYQPQIDVASGAIVGMEALVRWRHPGRGLLAPDEFIQVAEESGLILPLGEWSIRQACAQIREMRDRTGTGVRIAVNLSARQFADPNLPDAVGRALQEAGLQAGALELEITETMLMDDIDEAIGTLETLHAIGVSLAVDDFGTGYSSLNYLKRLPLDRVKVDRVFVSDIPSDEDDAAITSAVIAMAHQLKLEVVAEGVETQAQLEFLAAAQCELVQGYLFGAPLPCAEAEALLGARPLRPGVTGA